MGWEVLAKEIVEQVKGWYLAGFDGKEMLYPDYDTEVLSRAPKYPLNASLSWLVEREALTQAQADRVQRIREHRNAVAHNLPSVLLDEGHEVSDELFAEMLEILLVLGRFWGRLSVELDERFVGQDIKDEDIVSGTVLIMRYIVGAVEDSPSETPPTVHVP